MTLWHDISLRFIRLNASACEATAYKAQGHAAKTCPSEDETQASRQHPPLRFAVTANRLSAKRELSELTASSKKTDRRDFTYIETVEARENTSLANGGKVNIGFNLLLLYAIAVSLIRRIERPRVGARVFGQKILGLI